MKKTEWQKIKNKDRAELLKDLEDLKNKLWQLNIDVDAGKVKNIFLVRETKKNIARFLTLLSHK